VTPAPSAEDDAASVAGTEASDLDQLEASSSCDDFVMIQDGVVVSPAQSGELVSAPSSVLSSPAPADRSASEISAASAIAMVEAVAVADAADADAAAAAAAPVSVSVPAQVPAGWEVKSTPDGRAYFIDHNTQTTTWTHPITNVTSPLVAPEPEPVAPVEVVVQTAAEPVAVAAVAPAIPAPPSASAEPFLTTNFSAGGVPDASAPGSAAAAPSADSFSLPPRHREMDAEYGRVMDAELAQRLQDEEDRANSPHVVALTSMAAMGFFDQQKNEALLKKHKGDVERAVAELMD
jgi:hypothetical protein